MIERKSVAALDAALSAMFRTLEARGVPDHLAEAVDQLERSDEEPPEPIRLANRG